MKLEKISLEHKNMINNIKKDYDLRNDDYNGAFFIKDYNNYEDLIKNLNNYSNGIMDNPEYVPYTCYVLIENDEIVAVGSVRHYLNNYLEKFGGHIGYSVVPSKRLKGYGKIILKELLKEANKLEIEKVLVTCSKSNIGSKKIIEFNKGKFIDEIKQDDKITYRYIIDISGEK